MKLIIGIMLALSLTACGRTVTKIVKEPVEVKTIVHEQCTVKKIAKIETAQPTANILSLGNACIAKNKAYEQYLEELEAAASKCIKFVE